MPISSNRLLTSAFQHTFKGEKQKNNLDTSIAISTSRVLSTIIHFCVSYKKHERNLDLVDESYILLDPFAGDNRKQSKSNMVQTISSQRDMENTNRKPLSLPEPKLVLFSPENVQIGWKKDTQVGSGFINQGTTCYINSTLQALFHVPSFVNWLTGDEKHSLECTRANGSHHEECIVCAMSKTLIHSQKATGSSIKPRLIVERIKDICKHLSAYRQEDAHEFLRYLMEAMEKSYLGVLGPQIKRLDSYSKETTPLNQIFGGYIRTEVTCATCFHISTTFQHFQDLILDIRHEQTKNLYQALDNYFSRERLDGDESYHCERCKSKVSAYKKFSIEKAPNALCIQLKRFNINNSYSGSKISKLIRVPDTLSLSRYQHKEAVNSRDLKYRLVSMVFHHGSSANSGHYTALGSVSSGVFYYFNDEQVYPTNFNTYNDNSNTYIIFYELERSSNQPLHKYPVKYANTMSNGTLTNGYGKANTSFDDSSDKEHSFRTIPRREPRKSLSLNFYTERSAVENKNDIQINNTKENGPVHNGTTEKTLKENSTTKFDISSFAKKKPIEQEIVKYSVKIKKEQTRRLVPYKGSGESSEGEEDDVDDNNNNNSPKKNKLSKKITENGVDKPVEPTTNGINHNNVAFKRTSIIGYLEEIDRKEKMKHALKNKKNDVENNETNNKTNNAEKVTNGWVATDISPTKKTIKPKLDSKELKPSHGIWTVTDVCDKKEENNPKINEKPVNEAEVITERVKKHESENNNFGGQVNHCPRVFTWIGTPSLLQKEAEADRIEAVKRPHCQMYGDDIDKGKVKKPKFHHKFRNNENHGPRTNSIQEYQNHCNQMSRNRHNWHYSRGGGGRFNYNSHHQNNRYGRHKYKGKWR